MKGITCCSKHAIWLLTAAALTAGCRTVPIVSDTVAVSEDGDSFGAGPASSLAVASDKANNSIAHEPITEWVSAPEQSATRAVVASSEGTVWVGGDGAVASVDGCCQSRGCGRCGGRSGKIKRFFREYDYDQLYSDFCWPEQFGRQARRRVYAPFTQQIRNGEQVELTIWEHYFETDDDEQDVLNEAGKRRLEYLSRRRPYVITQLYLQSSRDQDLDRRRVAAIVAEANQQSAEQSDWQVAVVRRPSIGQAGPDAVIQMNRIYGTPADQQYIRQYEMVLKGGFYAGSGF